MIITTTFNVYETESESYQIHLKGDAVTIEYHDYGLSDSLVSQFTVHIQSCFTLARTLLLDNPLTTDLLSWRKLEPKPGYLSVIEIYYQNVYQFSLDNHMVPTFAKALLLANLVNQEIAEPLED